MDKGEEIQAKKDFLTVYVDIKGLEPFKNIISILGELVVDERVPEVIRQEYVNKILNTTR